MIIFNKSVGSIIGLLSAALALIALILYIFSGISNIGVMIGLLIVIISYVLIVRVYQKKCVELCIIWRKLTL